MLCTAYSPDLGAIAARGTVITAFRPPKAKAPLTMLGGAGRKKARRANHAGRGLKGPAAPCVT